VYSVCGCCTGSCQLEHACTSEYVSVTADRHKCPSVSCSVWEGTCSPLVCKEKGTAHLRCASSSQTGVTSRDRQMECRQGAQAGRQVDEETQAGRQAGGQAGRQAGRQTDGQTDRRTDRRPDGLTDRQTDRQADKQQMDTQMDRQIQKDRQKRELACQLHSHSATSNNKHCASCLQLCTMFLRRHHF